MRYANGHVYQGSWRDGKRHGKGTYHDASGYVYNGMHHNGAREGAGTLTFADKSVYQGAFRDGQRSGEGTWTAAVDVANPAQCDHPIEAGSVYVGGWAAHRRHGSGMLSVGGQSRSVRYEAGRLLSEIFFGTGCTSTTSQLPRHQPHGVRRQFAPQPVNEAAASREGEAGVNEVGKTGKTGVVGEYNLSPRRSTRSSGPVDVFLSLRFNEAMDQAVALQIALQASGALPINIDAQLGRRSTLHGVLHCMAS